MTRRVSQDLNTGPFGSHIRGPSTATCFQAAGVLLQIIYLICRCRSVLLTESEPTLASAPSIPAQRLDPEVLSSVHRDHVESLEALWSMEDCDDARAVLEYLQRAVHAQGTSTGLNGVQPCLSCFTDQASVFHQARSKYLAYKSVP